MNEVKETFRGIFYSLIVDSIDAFNSFFLSFECSHGKGWTSCDYIFCSYYINVHSFPVATLISEWETQAHQHVFSVRQWSELNNSQTYNILAT